MKLPTFYQTAFSLSILVVGTGCSQQTLQSAGRDVAKDAAIVQREAARAERKAKPDLQKLSLGTRVTAALQANQNLPSTIRVDANETGVFLRGSVRTASQKALAGRIARDTLAEQYSVRNDLSVQQ
jgi:osmotically-inducible protein OsmY